MLVDRCVCYNLSFAYLKGVADQTGAGFESLRALTRCSTCCEMCRPYVLLMLESGRTSFPPLSQAAAAEIVRTRGA